MLVSCIAIWQYTEGLPIEIPFLVFYLPEGWTLGVFYSAVSGLANISLLFIPLCSKYGLKQSLLVNYNLGLLFSIALTFLWDKTITIEFGIFEPALSIGFFTGSFFIVALDALRGALVFMSVEKYYPNFATAAIVGEVTGGFYATLLVSIQVRILQLSQLY